MIQINGERQEIASVPLLQYLEAEGYDARAIAVEHNGNILAKLAYATTVLQDGDVVEIVCFMGGGSC